MLTGFLREFLLRTREGPRTARPAYLLEIPPAELATLPQAERVRIEASLAALHAGRPGRARLLLAGNIDAAHAPLRDALAGLAELEAGNGVAAEERFARARRGDPELAGRLIIPGLRHIEAQDARRALGLLILALQLDPGNVTVMSRIADAYFLASDQEAALAWVATAYRNSGKDALRLKHVLMRLPAIVPSAEKLAEVRRDYLAGLRELESSDIRIADPFRDVNLTNFYLAYQGEDERAPQQQLARILLKACPSLGYVAPHCRRPRSRNGAIRVGFVSRNLGRHSVGMAFNNLVAGLHARPQFEVHAACAPGESADYLQELLGSRQRVLALPAEPAAMRQAIERLELDVILYPDIGMDPVTYLLSFSRLAPLQCVLAGHPLTSGVPNLDVFVSSALWEPPGAGEHYSERLLQLRDIAFHIDPKPVPAAPRARPALGLPEDRNLYVCPMKLQKFHPGFDAALAGILDADTRAEILLFEDHREDAWARIVRGRLERTLGAARLRRVRFHPWVTMDVLFEVLLACDIALDTFHFSGGTTAFYALSAGCPVVTLPGRFMRGRLACGYLRKLGLDECIAADPAQYVSIAVRIATDREFRHALRRKCAAAVPRLLDQDGWIGEFAAHLELLLEPAARPAA